MKRETQFLHVSVGEGNPSVKRHNKLCMVAFHSIETKAVAMAN